MFSHYYSAFALLHRSCNAILNGLAVFNFLFFMFFCFFFTLVFTLLFTMVLHFLFTTVFCFLFTLVVKNLQKPMTEIYKSLNNMNPSIVLEFHEKKCVKYDRRKKNLCKLPKAKAISYGVESISFRGSFLWNTLDDSIKQGPTLARFKNKIKSSAGDKCTCRMCQ